MMVWYSMTWHYVRVTLYDLLLLIIIQFFLNNRSILFYIITGSISTFAKTCFKGNCVYYNEYPFPNRVNKPKWLFWVHKIPVNVVNNGEALCCWVSCVTIVGEQHTTIVSWQLLLGMVMPQASSGPSYIQFANIVSVICCYPLCLCCLPGLNDK